MVAFIYQLSLQIEPGAEAGRAAKWSSALMEPPICVANYCALGRSSLEGAGVGTLGGVWLGVSLGGGESCNGAVSTGCCKKSFICLE